jgi:hypothetical protein
LVTFSLLIGSKKERGISMTTLDKIRFLLAKLVLLVAAIRLRNQWYEEFQEFEWNFIQFSRIIPDSILRSDLEVYPSSLKDPWYYLTKEPRLWNEEEEDEDQDDFEDHSDSFEDYPDDEDAAVRLLAHTVFTPEFQDAIQEHPEWKDFLV